MVCGLAMVLCMMIGLLLSAVYSHLSYRSIIGRLHFAFKECPQKPELAGSLDYLESPLLLDFRNNPEGHQFQRSEFRRAVRAAREATNNFLRSLDNLRPGADIDPSTQSIAKGQSVQIDNKLDELDKLSDALADPKRREKCSSTSGTKSTGCSFWPTKSPISSGAFATRSRSAGRQSAGFLARHRLRRHRRFVLFGTDRLRVRLGLLASAEAAPGGPPRRSGRLQLSSRIHPPGRDERTG